MKIDTIKMSIFIERVFNNLLPFNQQETMGSGEDFWCEDWELIEVCKYILIGEADYLYYRPPHRGINNKNFDKVRIVEKGRKKLSMMDKLDKVKNESDSLIVFNFGRGLDLILASMIRDWEICYCIGYNANLTRFYEVAFSDFKRGQILFSDTRSAWDKVKVISTAIVDDEVYYGTYGIEKIHQMMVAGG